MIRRLMLDGIASDASAMAAYPGAISFAAGYVDGLYKWSDAEWALFPNSVHVRIAVFADTDDGHVLDCEKGNCTPAQSVDWVLMRRAAGVDPTVYCNELAQDDGSGWPAVRAAFHARGVAEPHYWVANYPADPSVVPPIPAGAIGLQYEDAGPYDLSVVADYWPGVDPRPEDDIVLTADEIRLLKNVERLTSYMGRYADAAASGGNKAAFREIPGLDFLTGGPVTVLNPIAYLEELIGKVAVAPVAVDLAALKTELLAALADPALLAAQAHAEAVETHRDTPAA